MFLAFAEESTSLSVAMVQDVIGDLDFENHYWMADRQPVVRKVGHSDAPELQNLLSEISRRIESIEQSVAAPLNAALKVQNDRFESLQSSVTSQTAETKNQIMSLARNLEELRNVANKLNQDVTAPALPKSDFDWRMFGNDISPRRK
jgi:type VI protein secretion system component VasK